MKKIFGSLTTQALMRGQGGAFVINPTCSKFDLGQKINDYKCSYIYDLLWSIKIPNINNESSSNNISFWAKKNSKGGILYD